MLNAYCYGKKIVEITQYYEDLVVFRCEDGLLRLGRKVDIDIRED